MAHIEVWKGEKLITRREVDEHKAAKGCRVRLGSKGQVRIRLGESRLVGSYRVDLVADRADGASTEIHKEPADPVTTKGLGKLEFSASGQKTKTSSERVAPKIGGYRILAQIGCGGMGTVWRAIQLSTKREVALKLLGTTDTISKKAIVRFEREVSLAAKLTHPNIARIYDSGSYNDIYYYAMELVEGQPLEAYVQCAELDQRQILILIKKVCEAMAFAHSEGVIHRDLKPSNILVSHDGEPHILDFGLAKALEKGLGDLTISIEGEVSGTPGYMAPEQAAGRVETANELWDVYSLGVVLYQLLTLKMPHDMSGSPYDVFKRKVEQEVVPPREAEPSIDRDLECLLLKALAREPRERYASIDDFAADIENYLSGQPLSAKSGDTLYFVGKYILTLRKHRAVLAVVALALIILCYFFHEYLRTIESISVTSRQDRIRQEKYWESILDSRIRRYCDRLSTAINSADWQVASEELKRLRGALSQRRDLYGNPDIGLEEQANQWEQLIREGIVSSRASTRLPPTDPSRSRFQGPGSYPYRGGRRSQPDTYGVPQGGYQRLPRGGASSARTAGQRSAIGVETPLGIVDSFVRLSGGDPQAASLRVRSGHVLVLLSVTARKRYNTSSVSDWALIDSRGRRYPVLAIKTKDGVFSGLGKMSASGSPRAPQSDKWYFEVPESAGSLSLSIGNRIVGRVDVSGRGR